MSDTSMDKINKAIGMCGLHGLHGTEVLILALAAERDALRAALKQIAEGRFSLAPAPDYVTNPTPSPQDIASAALNEIARAV